MFYIHIHCSPENLQIQELDWCVVNSTEIYLSIYIYKTRKPHQFYNYKNVYISKPYRLLLYISNNWKKNTDMELLKYRQLLMSHHRWLLQDAE